MDDNKNEVVYLYLDDIIPNRFQPREVFDDQALKELAVSIREHGVIQPIIVRKVDNKYEIIAGERRYKASTMAGLTKIPAIIKNLDDKESSKVALIENLQRRDLTPIEEARTYQKILELEDEMTQEELAATMGKTQSSVSNKLRLLSLPEEVQDALLKEKISERHARSLLNIEDKNEQVKLLNRIIEEKMTVRELEKEIKILKGEVVDEEEPKEENKEDGPASPIEEVKEESTESPSSEERELDSPSLDAPIIEQTVEETTEVVTEATTEEQVIEVVTEPETESHEGNTEAVMEAVIETKEEDTEAATNVEETTEAETSAIEAIANDQQALDDIVKNVTEKVNGEKNEDSSTTDSSTTPKLDLNKLFNPFAKPEEKPASNNAASVVSSPVIGAVGGKDVSEAVKKIKDTIDVLVSEGYNVKVSESDILRTHEIKIVIFK